MQKWGEGIFSNNNWGWESISG